MEDGLTDRATGTGTDGGQAGADAAPPEDAAPAGAQTAAAGADAGEDEDALAAQLRLLVVRLQRRLRVEAGDELTPSQTAALVSVQRHGPLTLGRLAELERVTPPSITRIAAALEAAGLVRREVDPGDRRVARVAITEEGAALLQRSRTRKNAFLAERLAELGAADLAAVRDAVPVLERFLEEDR